MTLNQYTPEEPITSIATALAPAALGIIRVSGKNSIQLVSKCFSRPKALLEAMGNTVVYGWIVEKENKELGSRNEESWRKIDEVMCAVYRAPKSFTGEDMVEIFCHGGPSVVTAVQNLMLKSGFRQANRGEYTFRAYINGKTDLTKAEAVKEIIDSHTDVSRSHAVGRLSGSLFTEIDQIKKLIIDTLAAIEVEIEYPEDEETIADTFNRSDIENAITRLQSLADSWKSEKLYQDGARVVLAGRTNAGKSSLFNAILKEDRAIVSDIEGTTRDWLESWASINGIPVRLFDTAGLRQTSDIIEAKGVELSKNLANDADLVLYLVDCTAGLCDDDKEFISHCDEPLIIVFNKADKADEMQKSKNTSDLHESLDFQEILQKTNDNQTPVVFISAKNGDGLRELFDKMAKILTSGLSTEREQAGLGSARQKEAVQEALECTKHALLSADDNYTLDAVVQDLEDALDALGEVTGDVTPDDVLGSIFANFCVGK
ncbi:MAG: tRNA uridine-5-carboxymethylaminomethyl(34) synthesis GTPase MnmE [Spirochaetia bacterium]|nr:tRNA uridine-5-carboxymethylaminomethyl(34) synthesis GTPase MnmE [Spirochaetia bacterium]